MTTIKAKNITWHRTHVDRKDRERLLRQKGCTIWFTGLPSSGKSTTAFTLEHQLIGLGYLAYVLDGDNVRHGLNKNLGFSAEDREENIRRIGEVAKLFAREGQDYGAASYSGHRWRRVYRQSSRGRLAVPRP